MLFSFVNILSAQDTDRIILRGKVLYRNSNVVGENVINVNTKKATITNDNGQFEIYVQEGDTLVFSALNYQFKSVRVSKEFLENRRMVVEVKEKVTELDEVVVSPERQARFLKLEEEKFEGYDYERDKQTKLRNEIMTEGQFTNGINFVNIFRAIAGTSKSKDSDKNQGILFSNVLRQVYEDEFFVADLGIPQNEIDKFLFFLDGKISTKELMGKDREFQLIDFLVTQSIEYKKL